MRKRKHFFRPFVWVVMMVLPVLANAQQPGYFSSNGKSIQAAAFDRDIAGMMDDVGVPGMSLAVIEGDRIVYNKTYGVKQVQTAEKVADHTVFEACSLSKLLLVYVVGEMVEKGQLDLNKPMYEYLEYAPLKHDERYKKITPKMILSHTSGIENWRWYNNADTLEILNMPGTSFVYSGEGYQYLAKVVEKILQEPYELYVARRVLQPMGLKDSYLKYTAQKQDKDSITIPSDYAIGYNDLQEPVEKWKNHSAIPASGLHTTAGDYARFMVHLFSGRGLTGAVRKQMLTPVMAMYANNDMLYTASGIFIIRTAADTVAFFNGSNDGFKAEMFYSVTRKRGFVFMTNSDRGVTMTERINEMCAGLDLQPLVKTSVYPLYPSPAFTLLKKYRKEKDAGLLAEVQRMEQQRLLKEATLNELGDIFMQHDKELAKKLLEKNIALYPSSSMAHSLLGGVYLQMEKYDSAYKYLSKGKALTKGSYEFEGPLQEAESKVQAAKNTKENAGNNIPGNQQVLVALPRNIREARVVTPMN